MKKFNFYILLLVLLGVACAKEELKEPEVFISNPAPGASFKVYDSIPVVIQINSEEELNFLNIRLLNSSLISVNPVFQKSISGNSFTGLIQYYISNKQLADGNYFIAVTAGNNDVQKTAYKSISVQALPLQLIGKFISVWSGSNSSILHLDSGTVFSTVGSILGKSMGSAVNRDAGTIHFLTSQPEAIVNWSAIYQSMQWTMSCLGSFLPCITNVSGNVNSICASYREGLARIINQQQITTATLQSNEFGYPELSQQVDNFVLVEEWIPVNSERVLKKYFAHSGAGQSQQSVAYDVKAMLKVASNSILLVAEEGSNVKLLLYNLDNDFISSQNQILNESVLAAVSINQSRHLISTPNGIYEYQSDLNQYFLINGTPGITQMKYDPIESYVYAVSSSELKIYFYQNSTLQMVNSVIATDTIRSFDLIYNK
ncbi:MAG TPA: hypothetical protein PKH65_09105 [Bacteroidia bacterium]|nr:hypothetical protein [Bacteroidia bacterium]HNT80824.1 hypothetical protein [Bacteroidia bacterium]